MLFLMRFRSIWGAIFVTFFIILRFPLKINFCNPSHTKWPFWVSQSDWIFKKLFLYVVKKHVQKHKNQKKLQKFINLYWFLNYKKLALYVNINKSGPKVIREPFWSIFDPWDPEVFLLGTTFWKICWYISGNFSCSVLTPDRVDRCHLGPRSSLYLSIYLFIYLSIYRSIYLSIYIYIYLSI